MSLISIEQAAKILNIGRTTAYRLAKQGRLPCVRSFGPLRVHAEKLQQMIEAESDASMSGTSDDGEPTASAAEPKATPPHRSSLETSRQLDALLQPARAKPHKDND